MTYEMNFCRRCGAKLTLVGGNAYKCDNGHTIYWNSTPAVCLLLTNDNNEVLTLVRAHNPGKGALDLPGGFCDLGETPEDAMVREMLEETGLKPADYTNMEYLLSGIDHYQFGGEEHIVVTFVFTAKMRTNARPVAGDDAAEAGFMPLHSIDPQKAIFPTVQAAYVWAKDNL